jgi:uncharacterized paraquat-inducible protein A
VGVVADNTSAVAGLIVASIVIPVTILAIVVWLFFRSARRFDEEQRR